MNNLEKAQKTHFQVVGAKLKKRGDNRLPGEGVLERGFIMKEVILCPFISCSPI
jgi:hypothetical protein